MLMAFDAAEEDQRGCQFHSVQGMIASAWDIRSARKLEELNLVRVEKTEGMRVKWHITEKGSLVAQCIRCDSNELSKLKLHNGGEVRSIMTAQGNEDSRRRKERKRR